MLAGFVRMGEFALIMLVGMAVYCAYLHEYDGMIWRYLLATFVVAGLSMLAFQIADIYQVQAFRGHEKQYMRLASAWSVVFLIVIGASFLAKAGECSRASGSARFYVVGFATLMLSRRLVFLLVRKWTREGRLNRRTVIVGGGETGAHVIEELHRQKDTGVKIIGLFDDRGDDRTGSECAGERKLGTVDDLVEFGRRTRVDLVIFSLPISAEAPHPADAEEAVGAAGRHPPCRARQQAAVPPALLFLHRQGAGARRRRPADRRLGRGDEMAVRQDHRRPHSALPRCR